MALAKKLFIKNGYRVNVVNAPEGFVFPSDELPGDVVVERDGAGEYEFALLFVRSQAELQTYAPTVLEQLKANATFWVAYPKKSSKIKSDISRDEGWGVLNERGFVGVSLVSIDDTWSAMRFRKAE